MNQKKCGICGKAIPVNQRYIKDLDNPCGAYHQKCYRNNPEMFKGAVFEGTVSESDIPDSVNPPVPRPFDTQPTPPWEENPSESFMVIEQSGAMIGPFDSMDEVLAHIREQTPNARLDQEWVTGCAAPGQKAEFHLTVFDGDSPMPVAFIRRLGEANPYKHPHAMKTVEYRGMIINIFKNVMGGYNVNIDSEGYTMLASTLESAVEMGKERIDKWINQRMPHQANPVWNDEDGPVDGLYCSQCGRRYAADECSGEQGQDDTEPPYYCPLGHDMDVCVHDVRGYCTTCGSENPRRAPVEPFTWKSYKCGCGATGRIGIGPHTSVETEGGVVQFGICPTCQPVSFQEKERMGKYKLSETNPRRAKAMGEANPVWNDEDGPVDGLYCSQCGRRYAADECSGEQGQDDTEPPYYCPLGHDMDVCVHDVRGYCTTCGSENPRRAVCAGCEAILDNYDPPGPFCKWCSSPTHKKCGRAIRQDERTGKWYCDQCGTFVGKRSIVAPTAGRANPTRDGYMCEDAQLLKKFLQHRARVKIAEQIMKDDNAIWEKLDIDSGSTLQDDPDLRAKYEKAWGKKLKTKRYSKKLYPDVYDFLENENYHTVNELLRKLGRFKGRISEANPSDIPSDLMEQFVNVATAFSPENLCCDGEASPAQVKKTMKRLTAEWKALEKKAGRKVTEEEVWGYVQSPRANPNVQNTNPGDNPIITAKFPGKCRRCGQFIEVGERIDWTPGGGGAVHVDCSASRSSAPSGPRLRRDGTYECEECGEYVTPGSSCWETGARHNPSYHEVNAAPRPPKKWFWRMYKDVAEGSPHYSDEQVRSTVGSIWYHRIPETTRAQIMARENAGEDVELVAYASNPGTWGIVNNIRKNEATVELIEVAPEMVANGFTPGGVVVIERKYVVPIANIAATIAQQAASFGAGAASGFAEGASPGLGAGGKVVGEAAQRKMSESQAAFESGMTKRRNADMAEGVGSTVGKGLGALIGGTVEKATPGVVSASEKAGAAVEQKAVGGMRRFSKGAERENIEMDDDDQGPTTIAEFMGQSAGAGRAKVGTVKSAVYDKVDALTEAGTKRFENPDMPLAVQAARKLINQG